MQFTTTAADCRLCNDLDEVRVHAQKDAGRGIWHPNYHDGIGLFSCTETYKAAHLEITKRRAPDVGPRFTPKPGIPHHASIGDRPAPKPRRERRRAPAGRRI